MIFVWVRLSRGDLSMFLKQSALAAGCMAALISFDAGRSRPRIFRWSNNRLSRKWLAVADLAGIAALGAAAAAIGVPGAGVAGSGQRLGGPAVFAVGKRSQNWKTPHLGISIVRQWRSRKFPRP
jgi:hypothetical protein